MSFRGRQFRLMLYEDDSTHVKAIEKIKRCYDCAYIRHDMDTYEEDVIENGSLKHVEGELKKPHFHVVIKFLNARSSKAIAKDLGITENYLKECNKYREAMEYLIHLNNPEKYLYSIDDVHGSLKKDLVIFLAKHEKDENIKVQTIYSWIEKQPRPLTVTRLAKWCYSNGYWDVFRRSSSIFFRIIDEHNFNKNECYLNNYEEVEPDEFFYQMGTSDMFNDENVL